MSVTGGVLGGGGQELRETISNVFLKSLLLQNCACHTIFFDTLRASNVCHGREGVNKNIFKIINNNTRILQSITKTSLKTLKLR